MDSKDDEIIEENKKLLEKWPWLEKRGIFTDKPIYEGDKKYCRTDWNDWDGSGWESIWKLFLTKLGKLWEKLPDDNFKKTFKVWDSKEKFGTLRVSLPGFTEEMEILNWSLQKTSKYTCMSCGKQPRNSRGKRIIWLSKGWIAPYCKECAKKEFRSLKRDGYTEKGEKWQDNFNREELKGPFEVKSYSNGKYEVEIIPELEEI